MPKGASSATARQRPGAVTFARLTPYLRGIIYGLTMADYGVQDIIKEVEKADGAPPIRSAVLRSLALSDRMGGLAWDGVVPSAGGRPNKTSEALEGNHNRTPSSRDTTNVTTASISEKTRPSMLRASTDAYIHQAPAEPTLKGAVFVNCKSGHVSYVAGCWCLWIPY